MDYELILRLTTCLVAGRSVLNALEMLYDRQAYSSAGLFSWPARRQQRPWTSARLVATPITALLDRDSYTLILWVQLLTALLLIASPLPLLAALWLLLVLELISDFRNSAFGRDGSDRMHMVVLVALTLTASLHDPMARRIGVLFIALQALVAYFVSGAIKVHSPAWRDGRAMATVLCSENYGCLWAGRQLKAHPGLSRVTGWAVIVFEVTLPFTVLFGPRVTAALLAVALCFHLGVAATMGLNSFVWSFGATYPAIYCTSVWVHHGLLRYTSGRW